MKTKGFALIELVEVACILGIIGIVGLPVIGKLFQIATVQVEGKEVFHGHAFCVNVESAGAATTVDIWWPCTFPGKHYTNKDVKVTVQ